ncbi:hypothetical protein Ndes2526B_g06062 [Nannochloris sp. 'desiccata']|nr:hypothetical protein KSW81_007856 [Chlorella desiccata (nom. nud.)]KAH7619109.1 putative NADH dehydrogenase [ubiquinone] 1 beta subcomplex subunit 10-B [Chlorella desiccata (nom. nud.)]
MPFVAVNPPEEPKNYDPDNKYKDPVVYFKHREAAVAEEYVKVAEAKLLRTKLVKCYKESGTNFVTDCKELALKYMESIKGTGIARANAGANDKASWS